MPPKIKISASEVIDVALNIVRKGGWDHLNARAIARELGTSTSPIYVHFDSMEALQDEVIKKAFEVHESYQAKTQTNDILADSIGFVQFAIQEPNLFDSMHETKNLKAIIKYRQKNFDKSLTTLLHQFPNLKSFGKEQQRYLMYLIHLFLLGIAYAHYEHEYTDPRLAQIRVNDLIRDGLRIIMEGYIKTRTQPKIKEKMLKKGTPTQVKV